MEYVIKIQMRQPTALLGRLVHQNAMNIIFE